jgi:hypothetical protein
MCTWGACHAQGDSIIVGFHTPLDALEAALAAQEALLQAAWPEALLAHPLCAPQYALPRSAAFVDQVCHCACAVDTPPDDGWTLPFYSTRSSIKPAL